MAETPPHAPVADPLIAAAVAIRQMAYVPYSKFKVAAAVLTEGGTIHTGVNVENAAYPQSQCAEATAIGAMITAGHRRIKAVLVIGGKQGDGMLCAPCGGCRQRIREFAALDIPVYICGPDGLRSTMTLDELLPKSFGPDNLSF